MPLEESLKTIDDNAASYTYRLLLIEAYPTSSTKAGLIFSSMYGLSHSKESISKKLSSSGS